MLYSAAALRKYEMQSVDGDVREIAQFYFDDRTWIIRYVGAEASTGPSSDLNVLIPSKALLSVDESEGCLNISLTKAQIEGCPELKNHLPVSSQSEPHFHDYYDPSTTTLENLEISPHIPDPDLDAVGDKPRPHNRIEDGWDRHLRSTHALTGYHVESQDGEIGHIEDFIIDDQTWTIRYLVINAHHWWPGGRTLIASQWVQSISAEKSQVVVSVGREAVKESPEYYEHATITRDYETALYGHYDRKGYWLDRPTEVNSSEMPRGVSGVSTEIILSASTVNTPVEITVQVKRSHMLINAIALKDYVIKGLDGPIGRVKQFYFEDRYWTIRYLVAETGHWLADKQVLISPRSLVGVLMGERYISVNLTKQQIENSPVLDSDKPVSRQFEDAYYGYYGWPSPYIWGAYPYIPPPFVFGNRGQKRDAGSGEKAWDAHLRSTHDVMGHHVHATDGDIGHVIDFIIDDQAWAIRYLVIDTRNWWPGKSVLIAPEWVENIDWDESKVFVNVTRDQIRQAPDYTEGSRITSEYESQLRRHYNQHGYFLDSPAEAPERKIVVDSPSRAEATAFQGAK